MIYLFKKYYKWFFNNVSKFLNVFPKFCQTPNLFFSKTLFRPKTNYRQIDFKSLSWLLNPFLLSGGFYRLLL